MLRSIATCVMLASAFPALAQQQYLPMPIYVGPVLGYTAVVSSPDVGSVTGTPVRISLGVDVVKPLGNTAALRFSAAYRIEQAEYSTRVEPTARPALPSSMVDVGEPDPTTFPIVQSRQTLGSTEITTSLQFVVLPLGADGSHVFAGIGGMLDYVLHATQTDDWTGVTQLPPEYPKTWDYDLGGQFGGGGLAYAGVALNLGDARLMGDVRYVGRTAISSSKSYDWLAGRGVRIGVGLWFPL